jgi:hypothetical protein
LQFLLDKVEGLLVNDPFVGSLHHLAIGANPSGVDGIGEHRIEMALPERVAAARFALPRLPLFI